MLSPVKKSSGLNQNRNMHRLSTVYKWKQSKTVLNKNVVDFYVRGQQGLFHWRKCYFKLRYLARINSLKLKASAKMSYKHAVFTSQYINGWTGVVWITCGPLWCFYQLFGLSDGTHSLQRIHRWASGIMLNLAKTFLIKKQTHLHLEWPENRYIFIAGWTTPLKKLNEHIYCTVC